MGKYEFFEGQVLSHIWWDGTELMHSEITVGKNGVVSIKVSMECGQMAGVPWAVVFYDDGSCTKHNLAMASGVELAYQKEAI